MSDYIKREDAERMLWKRLVSECFSKRLVNIFMDDIAKIPAAEQRDEKTAFWFFDHEGAMYYVFCTACDMSAPVAHGGYLLTPYCPWCGTKMAGFLNKNEQKCDVSGNCGADMRGEAE